MGHPSANQLLAAVQMFLKDAEAELDGRLAFHARVAANSLAIVGRELELAPDAAEAAALAPFGGVGPVCEALRSGTANPECPVLLAALRASALARLAVDNPKYATFQRLRDREIG